MNIVTERLLAEIPLFSNMDEEERSELRSLMTERIFQPGQVVMTAGEPGGTLIFCVAGRMPHWMS